MLSNVKVVGWPCFQVVDVLLSAPLDHQVILFSIYLIENFCEGIPFFFSVVIVEFVHIESEIRQHLIIELIKVRIFHRILTVDFSEYVTKDHKHASFI